MKWLCRILCGGAVVFFAVPAVAYAADGELLVASRLAASALICGALLVVLERRIEDGRWR